jgi:hypothetical protein
MGRSDLDPGLLRRLLDEGFPRGQQYLLWRVVRSVDLRNRADESVATFRTLAIDVGRTEASLRSHADIGQPGPKLLSSICHATMETIDQVIQHRPNDPTLNAALAILQNVFAQLPTNTIKATASTKTAARSAAANLAPFLAGVDGIVSALWSAAWRAPFRIGANTSLFDEAVRQVAGRMALTGRDAQFLVEDLKNRLRRGANAVSILDILIPNPTSFQVACVVDGVSSLRDFDSYVSGARTVSLRGDPPTGWGSSTKRLMKFFSSIQAERQACLVLIQIDASDKGTAAMQGRRIVEESLDQYVMSGRLLDARLGDRVLVGTLTGNSTAEISSRGPGAQRAYALTSSWPDGLRESMRMAHLARSTESPLTRAALAWVAFEACNIKQSKINDLAAALALQAFRNQIVNSYEDLRDTVKTERLHRVQRASACEGALAARQKSRNRATAVGVANLDDKVAASQYALDVARADLDQFDLNIGAEFAAVEICLGPRTADGRYLKDPNNWLTLLSSPLPGESHVISSGRSSLGKIEKISTWPALTRISGWRNTCSRPAGCADVIDDLSGRFAASLTMLYAIRNLAFHGGVFSHHGDALLGNSGLSLVDLTMEFLGNWNSVERRVNAGMGSASSSPLQVIELLAQRKTNLVTTLRQARTLDKLNITYLTGPVSNGLDRT